MFANDMKKGQKVMMKNGWAAVIMDNKKGNIRFAEVDGIYKELGSIYVKDIAYAVGPNGEKVAVEMSPAQKKSAAAIAAMGF